MKLLLDENVPLPLYRRLRGKGLDVEHIIALGQRGLPDSAIRQRLMTESLVFLTHDTEFADLDPASHSLVVVSRVPQSLPIDHRVEIWFAALVPFIEQPPVGRLFELVESGEIVAWSVRGNRS